MIKIRIAEIELNEFSAWEENFVAGDPEIDVGTMPSFFFEKMRQRVGVSIKVRAVQRGRNLLHAELTCSFAFSDEMIKELCVPQGLSIPEGLCREFASTTYQTLRGIVYVKTKGSPLNSVILPLFDFSPFITTAFVIPL